MNDLFVGFLGLVFLGFMVLVWCRIVGKTGMNPALGLLLLVPIVNVVMLAYLAFGEWPLERELAALREPEQMGEAGEVRA